MKLASDEAPKLKAADFARAKFRVDGKDVSREQWRAAARAQLGKERITIMIDADVLAAFKAQAGVRGYQTLINQALRRALDRETLKSTLRQVLREEIQTHD